VKALIIRGITIVSMWAESPGSPGVHRFAAGAAKTGVYGMSILTRSSNN
jgi:hypothetical protein